NSGLDWRLEYGHRTFGFLVGMCGISLSVGCYFFDRRLWMGWLGFLALAMICGQGVLGISRVDFNPLHGKTLALIHGVFAQLVFAMLVSLAWFTSRSGQSADRNACSTNLQVWSIVTTLIVFAQLVLGGLVRHKEDLLGPRSHLLGAFVVVAAVVWMLKLIRDSESRERFRVQHILLLSLLALQMVLGVESWLAKFFVEDAVNQ